MTTNELARFIFAHTVALEDLKGVASNATICGSQLAQVDMSWDKLRQSLGSFCSEKLVTSSTLDNIHPKQIAHILLNYTLKEIIELQTLLAQQGVVLEFHTAEVQILQYPESPCPPSHANVQ